MNNLERLEIRGLDLVDRHSFTNWSEYENETAEFEVKQEPKQTRLIIKNPNRLKIKRIRIAAEGNFKRTYKIVAGSDDEFTYN